MNRLTDNDHNFGPLTIGKVDWNPWRIVYSSGGSEEYPETDNSLIFYAFGYAARLAMPNLIRPYKQNHSGTFPDGTEYDYDDTHPRDYGICLNEGFLNLFYGPQTHDSTTTKSKGYFLPWTQWRHVRHSLYDDEGKHYFTIPRTRLGTPEYRAVEEKREACPSVSFLFKDYDGVEIAAKTTIEEREWLFGEGWFKWLSWFRPPMVRRSLNIDFSEEVGPEKGSWKGGTVGHSIDMLPDELHEDAFKRYCEKEHRSKYRKYRIEFIKEKTNNDGGKGLER